jgi:PEGA domain-containing protein
VRRTISVTTLLVVAFVALALTPTSAYAQRRHGRAAAVFIGGGYFYDPFIWDPFWYPYPAYQFYPPYPPYPYYGRQYIDDSSIRLQVSPKEAQVYIDGYYAGIVDDFDGVFQRLHVEAGEHDLVLYLEGYRSVHEHLSLARNGTYKVKYTMEKLAPGEPTEPKPVPAAPPQMAPQPPQPQGQPPMRGPERRPRAAPPPPPTMMPPQEPESAPARGYGVLAIRVQPSDAEVLIDNEPWQGPQGDERLLVQVAEGPHHVEIRKQGRRTFSTDVTVRGGETIPLNVSLSPGDEQ